LKTITTIVKVLSILSALSSYASVLPASVLPIATLSFLLASTVKDAVVIVGDYLDDKQLNKSYTGQ
jgi:hypothetical protein